MTYDLLTLNGDVDDNLIHRVLGIPRSDISDRLVVLLRTYGGSPQVAYRTMHHLNAIYKGKKIDFVVPDFAMSAGTLMCLGGDAIYMYEGSCLGPLDLQISHPTDGGQISSIDVTQSVYLLFSLTASLTKQLYEQAIDVDEMRLGKSLAAKLAHESATSLLKPMVEKIDPYHLHSSFRGGSLGQKYAQILLANRMLKGNLQQAMQTSKILAQDYQLHSYSITMEEADVYLKLIVKNISDLDVYEDIKSILYSIPEGVNFGKIDKPAPTPIVLTQETAKGTQHDKQQGQPAKS